MKPFITVGERVLFIDRKSKSRFGTWPKGIWLQYGATGTVTEFHPAQPSVTIRGQYFPGLEAYAVVRWGLAGECDTAIDEKDEGKRWERIPSKVVPMPVPMVEEPKLDESRLGKCYDLAWKHIAQQLEGTLVHGRIWSPNRRQMMGHAWVVTETGWVYEPVSNQYYYRDELYKAFKMKEEETYNPKEAWQMCYQTKHFGPWTKEERQRILGLAAFAQPSASTDLLSHYKVPPTAY